MNRSFKSSCILLFLSYIILLMACTTKYTIPDYNQYYDTDLKSINLTYEVGDTIDSLERNQYHLFPKAKDFHFAIIYQIGKGKYDFRNGYVVAMTATDGRKYRSVVRDPDGLAILYGFKEYPTIDWSRVILSYDDALGLPITDFEVAVFNNRAYSRTCGYGCCLASTISSGLLAAMLVMDEGYSGHDNGLEILGLVAAVPVCTGISAYLGNRKDVDRTVTAIKNSRILIPMQ